MTQPTWITGSNLGRYTSGVGLQVQLKTNTQCTFKLLNGTLPIGITLAADNMPNIQAGLLYGTPTAISLQKVYTFTIRATAKIGGDFADRTFQLTLGANNTIIFAQPGGTLFSTVDSKWVDYQIGLVNVSPDNAYDVWLVSGSLPEGLYLTKGGRIRGYAKVPMNELTGLPQTRNYVFSLAVDTNYSRDVKEFNITVTVSAARAPVILNKTPPEDITSDPYNSYYSLDGSFGVIRSGDEISFKIIGKDFNNEPFTYVYSQLPPGLVGDPNTGWITGKITTTKQAFTRYNFSVYLEKSNSSFVRRSETVGFSFVLANSLTGIINWATPQTLPLVVAGEQSTLKITATAETSLVYNVISGKLPPNLKLQTNGEISGRASYQPNNTMVQPGDSATFKFTVQAASPTYPEIRTSREFTLTILQPFSEPYDTLYLKVSPSIEDRDVLDELLTDTNIIPNSMLYRSNESSFGKAKSIKIPILFGIKASSFDQYIDAVALNHYCKRLYFGELKTAIARDQNGAILYEVVYVDIVDDLQNAQGISAKKEVEFITNDSVAYPNSLANMKAQLEEVFGRNTSPALLPKWMSSQQLDGNILGPIFAWVICYTLPGKSNQVKESIEASWYSKLKLINAEVDRYYVDKSATFNWNSDVTPPRWNSFPGGFPAPTGDEKDFYILFPRKDIQINKNATA